MFSSGKDDWATPIALFCELDDEFNFWMDAAAGLENHLCSVWLGPEQDHAPSRDGVTVDWAWVIGDLASTRAVWLNPPYSRGLQPKFIAKAAAERKRGVTTVMLLPARTDTKAFHDHIWNRYEHGPKDGIEVRFLKGRLKFVGAPDSAPFPSMVVVFKADGWRQ